ncbi:MFS transporter [Catellatospora chokoriensis]|uniref:MFS transporter n=1 Tax=Catellatospora chokoriensis TaxID=310353 RepID=A0A8J3K1K7_9ACTN|nr:MFS transporter [Catellatospora chokoriensis]GIF90772.1 MFS transporter [Catellatospora chokoriensis]
MLNRMINLLPAHPATRALVFSTLAGSTSRGLFITVSVIFFTRSVGLSAGRVGLGLTIAAVVGLLAGVPAGHLADRVGPRRVMVAFGVARAVLMLGYLAVHGFTGFVLVAAGVQLLEAGFGAANGALIAGSIPPEDRVRTRAMLRAVTNVGWGVGALLAGVALKYDTRSAYVTILVVCVALALLASSLVMRVPPIAAQPRRTSGPAFVVLRDRPYLALAALNGVLCIHYGMLNVAVPLWVVERTDAPAWVVAVLGLLNATIVVLFQIRASRGTATAEGAGVAQRTSGFLLLGACVLYSLAAGPSAWLATAALVAAAVVHVLGELRQAAGSWGISFDLAPDHAQGQYQGMYGTGFALAGVIAPALLATVVIGWGWPGWLLFGLIFAASGAAVPAAVRWARSTRPQIATTEPAFV